MTTLAAGPGTTKTSICPVTPPAVAEIVAFPTAAAVTRPEALTSATELVSLDHVTPEAGEVLPEASVMVADAWADMPAISGFVAIVIEREGDRTTGEVELDPPQPLRVSVIAARIAGRTRILQSPLWQRPQDSAVKDRR
jgi:FAD/FMN-containing dehydrogenase